MMAGDSKDPGQDISSTGLARSVAALMIEAMKTQQASTAETVRYWGACSEHFLEALGHLPPGPPEMALPRLTLMRMALECRLKAFICAARGGAPDSQDLVRLTSLARHCGLVLTGEQADAICRLAHGGPDTNADPAMPRLEAVCNAIDVQIAA